MSLFLLLHKAFIIQKYLIVTQYYYWTVFNTIIGLFFSTWMKLSCFSIQLIMAVFFFNFDQHFWILQYYMPWCNSKPVSNQWNEKTPGVYTKKQNFMPLTLLKFYPSFCNLECTIAFCILHGATAVSIENYRMTRHHLHYCRITNEANWLVLKSLFSFSQIVNDLSESYSRISWKKLLPL